MIETSEASTRPSFAGSGRLEPLVSTPNHLSLAMGRQAFDAVRSSGAPRSGPSTPQSENCSFSESIRSSPCNSQMLGKDETVPYGELIILGYNGTLPQGERGRRRSKYILYKRSVPNGIRKSRHYIVKQPQQTKAIQDKKQHSISYTLSRNQAVIVEYTHDDDTDLFQIGRSSESPIDFVVIDTPTSNKANEKVLQQSTISRFACRILVERKPPYTARIFAAGFDSARNIFLGEKATKWQQNSSTDIDGLTTNGVLIMHPQNMNATTGDCRPKAGIWREVSVGGDVYSIRETRSASQKGIRIADECNILQDGTLIDLCGATLMWRSADGLLQSPTKRMLDDMVDELNAGRPLCPVGLNTLVIPRKTAVNITETMATGTQPYVYLKCGHVQGSHDWGQNKNSNSKTCPMCLNAGPVAKLSMGLEPSFYFDCLKPTYCFNPCGHMASEATVRFWTSIAIPHGTDGFQAMCPFCANPIQIEHGFVRLIFQDHVDC